MRFWTVFALMAGLLAASPAWAQKRDDASMAEARQRYNEGLKFADESNHEAARVKFSQAWMLLRSPAILFNLARSEQLSGHLVEALEHFRLFVGMGRDPKVTEQQRDRAKEFVTELTAKVGQVEIDAAPKSQIAIDGKPVAWTSPAEPVVVMPGSHEVAATLEGNTMRVTVDAAAGAITKAKLKPEAPPPPPPGALAAPAATPEKPEEHAWSTGQIAGLAVAGGGVVAAGLGFYFHIDSSNAGDDADGKVQNLGASGCRDALGTAKPAACSSLADLRDRQDRSAAIRNGLWIGGGALIIGGAALFVLSGKRSQEQPRAWHVVPSVSPKSSGLAIVGAF
jgi:hypothetical protein